MKIKKFALYGCVILLVIWIVFPIYSIAMYSFMPEIETLAIPPHWIPRDANIDAYKLVLGYPPTGAAQIWLGSRPLAQAGPFKQGLVNSTIVATSTTIIVMTVSSCAAYAFARYRFKAKNGWLISLLFSRMLPGTAIIIPYYVWFAQLHLIGTLVGMIITYLAIAIPLATWILIGYFSSLPLEIEKAARVDGCGRLGTLLRVVVPTAGSGLAAVAVIIWLMTWGEFLFALVLSSGTPAQLMPPTLTSFLEPLVMQYPTYAAAATMFTLIPVVVVAVVFQRYITRVKIVDPIVVTIERGPLA
jgi:multiple sugar transport system permease protein